MNQPTEAVDDEVLRLRSGGKSFARISRDLDLGRPVDAQRAFQRAVGRLPADTRTQVSTEEVTRLDRLAARVAAETDRPAGDRERQLAAIERLRASLTTGQS